MDLVTQGLLGACVGHAVAGRHLGGKAMLFGAIGGLLPDSDALWTPLQSLDYWRYHRGITHSLIVLPIAAIPLAWISNRISEHRLALQTGNLRKGMSAARWYMFWALVLITHPLLDSITHWGTMLLAPLSDVRYGVSALPIIDIAYSLTLIAALIYAGISGVRTSTARSAMVSALLLSTAWIGYGYLQNGNAQRIALTDATAQGITASRIDAYTTLLTPWFRRVVATTPDGHQVGFVSTLNPQKIRWRRLTSSPDAIDLMNRVRKSDAGDVYWRFANGPMHPELSGKELKLYDMRYGTLSGTIKGFWGMAVPEAVARAGKPETITRAATKFNKRPEITWAGLAEFFRATFGTPQKTY